MTSRYLVAAACAASAVALVAPSSAAASVTISGSVTGFSLPGDPGLALDASAIAFADFTLASVGATHTTNVFRIGTNESSVDLDDLLPRSVSATFGFTSPGGASGTAVGSSSGFYRLFTNCGAFAGGCGRVDWTNPTIVNFDGGGQFSITLTDVEFGTPGFANVAARFELIAAPVPEPSTWAMLILGFGLVGGAMRSRRTRTSVAYA